MNKVKYERYKFYFLMILILASIIQVGILWSYKDYGFPISFFDKKNSVSDKSEGNAAKSLIDPYRIIVSEGFDGSRWILSNNTDPNYTSLWEDAKGLLESSLITNQQQPPIDVTNWSQLLSERSIVFEFKAGINKNLLLWLLDSENIHDSAPQKLLKIMIVPWQNTGILYIADSSKIYRYSLLLDDKKLEFYEGIFKKYNDSEESGLRKYNYANDFLPKKRFQLEFSQDVLGIVDGPEYSHINDIICTLPDSLDSQKSYTPQQVDDIAESVLGSEKDGYDRTIDENDNTIELKTQNKIYKIYQSGLLEYKNIINVQQADKGELKDALVNAYKHLSRLKVLVSGESSFYLTDIDESPVGSYKFKFDYVIDGTPIIFTHDQNVRSAVTIEANSKTVLECTAQLKSFKKSKTGSQYSVYFIALLDDLFKYYKELKNSNGTEIKDVNFAYRVLEDSIDQQIKPVWVLEATDRNYIVPMRIK